MNYLKLKLKEHNKLLLIIITIFQILLMFYYFSLNNNSKAIESINYNVKKELTYYDISNKLNINENIEILEAEDRGENWYVKISINGENKNIQEIINKIDSKIYSYDINGKDNNLSVILELYI